MSRICTLAVLAVLAVLGLARPAGAEERKPAAAAPFAFADFSWVPGGAGPADRPLQFGPFTGEFRLDETYHYSFRRPADATIGGSSEVFRHGELQLTQLGVGGDLSVGSVRGRVMTQFGLYSTATPRNDASPARGQWRLDDAYRLLSEAYGGVHLDRMHGIEIQAGLFMSYIGLWSYYNADNWTYQPSYVSSNTPWFFNGVRAQLNVTDRLKVEPWIVNGWQSYGRYNGAPGLGGQILWRPTGAFSLVANQYLGNDTFGAPRRRRFHTDESVMWKYHDRAGHTPRRAAVSLTVDAGAEWGGGVRTSDAHFLGFMAYHRVWLSEQVGLSVGGGAIRNPGRTLVLVPPVNGATAASGTAYFSANPGDPFTAWDVQVSADYAPDPHVTFRAEYNHRAADVPYFSGRGGLTPPGGNQGAPGSLVPGWSPDLVRSEDRLTLAMLIRM